MPLEIGTRLGPYEITGRLGAGGMGEVYRARDSRLGREVAIKVLPAHLRGRTESRQRFEREAKTLSQLQHPHLCALYDVGSEGGVEFLVLELLEGETLEERLQRGALPIAEVLDVGRQIAEALDAAHRHKVVHRDLKSGNVMLTRSGVKVLDFGLAKSFDTTPLAVETHNPTATQPQPLTAQGTIAGTLYAMPPEQLEGRAVDARTDVWALGVVLYEMATGERPFHGDSQASLIGAVMRHQPAAIKTRRPASPSRLDWVVARCLEKDPDRRWQSARDVAIELEAVAEETRTAQAEAVAATPDVRPTRRRTALLAAAAAAVILVLALAWSARSRLAPGSSNVPDPASRDAPNALAEEEREPSIAVLAFEDMSEGRDQAYFAEGISEAILNALTKVDGLRVMARTSAFSFRGQNATVQEIGERLDVAAVLEGSVQRAGDRVRITAQLIQTSDGFHLWSESFDRELAAIFELQDEIARAVVAEVGPKLRRSDEGPLIEPPTESQEAYDLYLLSWRSFDEQTEAGFEKGIELVRRAIELDPRFAQAHLLEGVHRHTLVLLGLRPIESWAEAVAALRRALDIDPELAEAHGLLGEIEAYRWNWKAAEEHGRRAIDLAPGSAALMMSASGLSFTGRTGKAVEDLERARALDPLYWVVNRNLGVHLMWDRQYDRAIRELRHSLALSGELPYTHWLLAEAHWLRGDHGQWAAELQQVYRLLGSEREAQRIGELFATSGARAVLEWWVAHLTASEENAAQLSRIGDPNAWVSLARSHLKLGDLDAAFAVLEQLIDLHLASSNALKVHPSFDGLRGDPRYTALLRRMNLEA